MSHEQQNLVPSVPIARVLALGTALCSDEYTTLFNILFHIVSQARPYWITGREKFIPSRNGYLFGGSWTNSSYLNVTWYHGWVTCFENRLGNFCVAIFLSPSHPSERKVYQVKGRVYLRLPHLIHFSITEVVSDPPELDAILRELWEENPLDLSLTAPDLTSNPLTEHPRGLKLWGTIFTGLMLFLSVSGQLELYIEREIGILWD